MTDFAAARQNMVESQVRPNRVSNPALIAAFEQVPREDFVPPAQRSIAYVDRDLDLGGGRFLMEPRVLARMIETADVQPGELVLDVGANAGYATAILARLGSTTVALESDGQIVQETEARLVGHGIDNAIVVEGPLADGHEEQAPYDVILFSGAVPAVPDQIAGQLAEGGRLVAVIRDGGGPGVATLFSKHGGYVSGRPVFDAATPFLPRFEPAAAFSL